MEKQILIQLLWIEKEKERRESGRHFKHVRL